MVIFRFKIFVLRVRHELTGRASRVPGGNQHTYPQQVQCHVELNRKDQRGVAAAPIYPET